MLCASLWAQCVTDIATFNTLYHRYNAEGFAAGEGAERNPLLVSERENRKVLGMREPLPGDLWIYIELRGDRQTGRKGPNVFNEETSAGRGGVCL